MICPFLYKGTVKELIYALKFKGAYHASRALSMLIERQLREDGGERDWRRLIDCDIILAVPLSKDGIRKRGYNQCLEVLRSLSVIDRQKLFPLAIRKIRHTPPQAMLSYKERLRNLKGAFWVKKEIVAGKRVLLFDDVITTGATIRELSRTIIKLGAQDIGIMAIARTPPKGALKSL